MRPAWQVDANRLEVKGQTCQNCNLNGDGQLDLLVQQSIQVIFHGHPLPEWATSRP